MDIFEKEKDIIAYFTEKPIVAKELIKDMADNLEEGYGLVKPIFVHGDNVVVIDKKVTGYIEIPDCDGLVTNISNVGLCTTHGDCLCIFAYDKNRKVIGIAHAGWKGTKLGIALKLVKTMSEAFKSDPSDILVYISPGIDKCHFEVTKEVRDEFVDYIPWSINYINQTDDIHYVIDLKGINEKYLKDFGITNIEISNECTYCLKDKYWSYRRSGDMNRMIGYIELI